MFRIFLGRVAPSCRRRNTETCSCKHDRLLRCVSCVGLLISENPHGYPLLAV